MPHSLTIQISDVSDTPPKTVLSGVEVNYFRIDEGTKLIKNLEITDSDGPVDQPTARVLREQIVLFLRFLKIMDRMN